MANQVCPCVTAEKSVCAAGKSCRHFSNDGVCMFCGLGLARWEIARHSKAIAGLLAVINHLRVCQECSETDVLKCAAGREVWIEAGLPVSKTEKQP